MINAEMKQKKMTESRGKLNETIKVDSVRRMGAPAHPLYTTARYYKNLVAFKPGVKSVGVALSFFPF